MNGGAETIARLNEARRPVPPPAEPAAGVRAGAPSQLGVRLAAAAKEGIDWTMNLILVGQIPVVGQVPGILYSAFFAFYLASHGWFRGSRVRLGLMALALIADNLPYVNNLPLVFLASLLR